MIDLREQLANYMNDVVERVDVDDLHLDDVIDVRPVPARRGLKSLVVTIGTAAVFVAIIALATMIPSLIAPEEDPVVGPTETTSPTDTVPATNPSESNDDRVITSSDGPLDLTVEWVEWTGDRSLFPAEVRGRPFFWVDGHWAYLQDCSDLGLCLWSLSSDGVTWSTSSLPGFPTYPDPAGTPALLPFSNSVDPWLCPTAAWHAERPYQPSIDGLPPELIVVHQGGEWRTVPVELPESFHAFLSENPEAGLSGTLCAASAALNETEAALAIHLSTWSANEDGSAGMTEPERTWLFTSAGDRFVEAPLPPNWWWGTSLGYLDGMLHTFSSDGDGYTPIRLEEGSWTEVEATLPESSCPEIAGSRVFATRWDDSGLTDSVWSTADLVNWQQMARVPDTIWWKHPCGPVAADFGWILGREMSDSENFTPPTTGPLWISGDGITVEALEIPDVAPMRLSGEVHLRYSDGLFLLIGGDQIFIGRVID